MSLTAKASMILTDFLKNWCFQRDSNPLQRIMHTTIAFATISVCGLDYAFAMLHHAI